MPRISEINPETAPEAIKKIIADYVADGHALTAEKRTLLHNATAFNAVEAGSYAPRHNAHEVVPEICNKPSGAIFISRHLFRSGKACHHWAVHGWIKRDDKCFLYGVLFNLVFHKEPPISE